MNQIKRKLKSTAGFTLAETLLAVLILLLVSVIVARGVPAAKNVYEKVFIGANAQALLSTTISALKDELGTAWDVSTENITVKGKEGEDKTVTAIVYFSADTGAKSMLYPDGKTNKIMIQEYAENTEYGGLNTEDTGIGTPHSLVSSAVSTANKEDDLIVVYNDVAIDGKTVKFKNLRVEHNNTVVARINDTIDKNNLLIEVVTVK